MRTNKLSNFQVFVQFWAPGFLDTMSRPQNLLCLWRAFKNNDIIWFTAWRVLNLKNQGQANLTRITRFLPSSLLQMVSCGLYQWRRHGQKDANQDCSNAGWMAQYPTSDLSVQQPELAMRFRVHNFAKENAILTSSPFCPAGQLEMARLPLMKSFWTFTMIIALLGLTI